jgi:hypothetical protein
MTKQTSKKEAKVKEVKVKKKPGRKKTKNYYWTDETEQAIIKYNGCSSEDEALKNKLYRDEIEYPFNKLAENIINTFKFSYFDDVFKHRDRMISYAIIDLMKARNTIEDFNKKAIYILLREMTNVETSHITKVLNVLRKHMRTLQNNFHSKGSVFPVSKIDKFS